MYNFCSVDPESSIITILVLATPEKQYNLFPDPDFDIAITEVSLYLIWAPSHRFWFFFYYMSFVMSILIDSHWKTGE